MEFVDKDVCVSWGTTTHRDIIICDMNNFMVALILQLLEILGNAKEYLRFDLGGTKKYFYACNAFIISPTI